MVSSVPDRALGMSMKLPWPANRLAFATLRRMFQTRGRLTGELTKIRFGTIEIEAPLSHPAVYWRYRPIGYNMNYVRLVESVLSVRDGIIIDVGANIGDGVALLRGNGVNATILAIEGAEEFVRLLKKNVSYLSEIYIACHFLSDQSTSSLSLEITNGTGKLVKGSSYINTISLDALYREYDFKNVAIIKTDTDGFDAKVIRGSQQILRDIGPVIFSELDDTLLKGNGDTATGFVELLGSLGYDTILAWDHNGRWLGHRSMAQGISDWIAAYPGGPGTPYIDIASFKTADRAMLEAFVASEDRFAMTAAPGRGR